MRRLEDLSGIKDLKIAACQGHHRDYVTKESVPVPGHPQSLFGAMPCDNFDKR